VATRHDRPEVGPAARIKLKFYYFTWLMPVKFAAVFATPYAEGMG
jgi:hypothetical protein